MAERKPKVLAENSKHRAPSKIATMPHEIQETIFELFGRFCEKFGRPPRANEPVFFDPDAHEPMPLQQQAANETWDLLADTMVREGELAPDASYAMKKTGLLVTPHTEHLLTERQRRHWEVALVEYQNALTSRRRAEGEPIKASLATAGVIPTLNCSSSDHSTLLPGLALRPERKRS